MGLTPSPVRLYRTAAGEVVREGHPDAHMLYAAVGRKVPVSVLEGLTVCGCGFEAVNVAGLAAHRRAKHEGDN